MCLIMYAQKTIAFLAQTVRTFLLINAIFYILPTFEFVYKILTFTSVIACGKEVE